MLDLTNTPETRATQDEARLTPSRSPEAHPPAVEGKTDKPPFLALLCEALTQPGRVAACYSMFHSYSLSNALWIAGQLWARGEPLAPIASFHRWRELGRIVQKGSKALCMCMPVTVKAKADTQAQDAETTEGGRRVLFVVRRHWFALHQTEPMEGTEPKTIETPTPDWSAERALEALAITRENFQHINGNVQGYAEPDARRVAVSPLAVNPIKTLLHEIAHCLLHSEQGRIEDAAERTHSLAEVEAESVAYLCCAVLGLPGLDESRGYVQGWLARSGRDAEAFTGQHARRVMAAADKILKAGRPQVEVTEPDA